MTRQRNMIPPVMTAPKVNPMPIKSSCDCNRLKMPNGRKMARMVLMAMIGAVIAQAATRSFGVVADAKNSGEKYQIAITPGENAPANPKTSNSISRPLALLICSIKFMEDVCYAPNDLKLSDRPGWRGPCAAGGEGGGQEAGAVTAGPVRCSAWLGHCVEYAAKRGRGMRLLKNLLDGANLMPENMECVLVAMGFDVMGEMASRKRPAAK